MDKQNSRGCSSHIHSTRDVLIYATELKVDIQSQVYELIAALKKREHELCLQVDRHCLEQGDASQILESYCMEVDNLKENCYFTPRLEFHSDFKNCKHLLQNYGQLKEFNCPNKIACESQINKNQLPKGSTNTQNLPSVDEMEAMKDPADSFEFVDSVECLLSEKTRKCQMVTANLPKATLENLSEKKEDLEEIFEKVSCCSVDSFDVIQADCCGMNDLASGTAQSELSSTPVTNPVGQASCKKINSGYPTFYLPNLQKREQKDSEWLARAVRPSPKAKLASQEPASTAKESSNVLPKTSEANVHGIAFNKSVGREDADKPANALQASFQKYLQKQDFEAWIHPKSESEGSEYELWVVKSPCISKGFDISDAVVNAFTRQFKSFVM